MSASGNAHAGFAPDVHGIERLRCGRHEPDAGHRPIAREDAPRDVSGGTTPKVRSSVLAAGLSPRSLTPAASSAATRLISSRSGARGICREHDVAGPRRKPDHEEAIAGKERRGHGSAPHLDRVEALAGRDEREETEDGPDQAHPAHRPRTGAR